MKLSEDLTSLARNNKIIMSGKQGEELLNYFKDTTDMVSSTNSSDSKE